MTAAAKEIEEFCEFAEQRMRDVPCDLTLDELYAEWRATNPMSVELDKSVAAVQASLRDLEAGESGRPVEEFFAEFRSRNGL